MANRWWVGAAGTTAAPTAYNTTASWSTSKDGASGASVPSAATSDVANFDKTGLGTCYVNVNTSIGNLPNINFVNGPYALAGSTSTTAGTAWTLTSPVEINVGPAASNNAAFNNSITGGGAINKTGPGLFGTTLAGTTWGTSPITITAGAIYFSTTNDKLGTGKITMLAGTELANVDSTARTLNNPIDVRGDVTLNHLSGIAAAARGTITLKATVDFDTTTRTVTIGGTGAAASNSITISGAVTGTDGFTKAGSGTLTFNTTSSMSGLSGTVEMTQGIMGVYSTAFGNITFKNSATTVPATPTGFFAFYPTVAGNTAFPAALAFSGSGVTLIHCGGVTSTQTVAGGGFVFGPGATTGVTGSAASTTSGAVNGIGLYTSGTAGVAGGYTTIATFSDLPTSSVISFDLFNNAVQNLTETLIYAPASGSSHTYGTRFDVITRSSSVANFNASIYANQASGALVLSGDGTGAAIKRVAQTASTTVLLTLRGNTAANIDNTISGTITETSGVLAIAKADANRWVLSGANTYTSTTTISGGTLSAQNNTALGASGSGAVTLASGATLELAGNITLNKASVAINLQGGTVSNLSGDNTYSGSLSPLTGSATTFNVTAGSLTWNPTISSATVLGIVKSSAGRLKLNNAANNYTGTTTVNAGTLEVLRLAVINAASSIGQPSNSANGTLSMAAGTTLKHSGANEANTTDRIIAVTSAGVFTIDSSGTGTSALTLSTTNSGAITLSNGTNELVFTGTNTVANTCARTIANPGTGTTALTKSGSNTWTFSGTLTYTGTTSCSGGVLDFGSSNRTLAGDVVISGGTVQNGTSTLEVSTVTMSGGALTATLTGTGTMAVNAGTTATVAPNAPTTGSNAQTGTTTVASGAVVDLVTPEAVEVGAAGNGRVLGNGTVSVTGTIRTKHSATSSQRGQARYKNLTLNSGSRLEIGAAA